jgi:hypothetical protein
MHNVMYMYHMFPIIIIIQIILNFTHRVLYPGHWLKMDQLWMRQKQMVQKHPVYFFYWEGDLDDLDNSDNIIITVSVMLVDCKFVWYTYCSQISKCLCRLRKSMGER